LFSDDALQAAFSEKGYVIVPFLTTEETQELTDFFTELHPTPPGGGLYASTHSADAAYRHRVSERLAVPVRRHIGKYLTNVTPLGGSYVVKAPNGQGLLPIHQDYSMVDESRHCSAQIWVPLVDVYEANGAVWVVEGSHRFTPTIRGPHIPWPYQSIAEAMMPSLKRLDMVAGHALIYDHALIHYSPVNQTAVARPAFAFGVQPNEAQLLSYSRLPDDPPGQVQVYGVDAAFYLNFTPWQRPEGYPLLETIQYTPTDITLKQYAEWTGMEVPTAPEPVGSLPAESFFSRLKRMLGV
jgi:hypothetical protein